MASTRVTPPDWEGAVNARVLAGDIYRMGRSEWLTATGWAQAHADGVRTVLDLRNPTERRRRPTDPPAPDPALLGIRRRHTPTEDPAHPVYAAACVPYMNHPAQYPLVLRLFPDKVAQVLRELAAAEGAVVVHCSAGRDRTGLIAALLLALAGRAEEAPAQDALATRGINAWRLVAPTPHPHEHFLPAGELDAVIASRGAALTRFLAELPVRAWLLAQGLDAAELDRLTERCATDRTP